MRRSDVVLFVLAVCAALAACFVAEGCATAQPGFVAIAPRIVERAEYGRCLEAGGKIEAQGVQVAILSSACVLATDGGSSAPAAPSSSSESPAASSALEEKDASSLADGAEQ